MSTEVDQFTYSISLHCLLSVMSCNYNSCRIFSILNKNDFKNNYNLVKNWLKSISLEDGRIVLNICKCNTYIISMVGVEGWFWISRTDTPICIYGWLKEGGGFWISRTDIPICMYDCIIYKYMSIDRIKSKEGSEEYINDKLSLLFIISNGLFILHKH